MNGLGLLTKTWELGDVTACKGSAAMLTTRCHLTFPEQSPLAVQHEFSLEFHVAWPALIAMLLEIELLPS